MNNPNQLMIYSSVLLFIAGFVIVRFRVAFESAIVNKLVRLYGKKAKIFDSNKQGAYALWAGWGFIALSIIFLCGGILIPPELF